MSPITTHAATRVVASGPAGRLVARLFAAVVLAAPIGEVVWSLAHGEPARIVDGVRDLAHRDEDKQRAAFEESLHDASILTQTFLPHYQRWMATLFGAGNKKVAAGRDDWLFLREDLENAYGHGVLAAGRAGRAAIDAIKDFRDQLDARGVALLLVPCPGKEIADPEQLSRATRGVTSAPNADLDAVYAELDGAGVDVIRVDLILAELRRADPTTPLYLSQDTHWTPKTMQRVAAAVAERTSSYLGVAPEDAGLVRSSSVTQHNNGDLVAMLGLADPQRLFPPMDVALQPIENSTTRRLVEPDPHSEVLLLGDSFTKVFSDPNLGLGQGAGFAEELAFLLQRPLDVIALAGGGATGTRQALVQRDDGLHGKRVVIWQFAQRLLGGAPEDWKRVKLPDAKRSGVDLDARAEVVAEITEVTRIPARFDYAFCLATYEYKVLRTISGQLKGDRLWVAFPAIVDRKSTEARSFEVGARHRLVLEPIQKHYNLDQTSWMDDTNVAGPIWFPVEWKKDDGAR